MYGGIRYEPQKGALRRGVDVMVATPGRLEDLVEQRSVQLGDVRLAVVDEADRIAAEKTIVFTRTRHGADRLTTQLNKLGVTAVALHGGRNQNQRNRALRSFASGSSRALIATDVAARGIHVDDVSTVLHYDPVGDHKDYIHRSGRTGRAGASGTVVSLAMHDQRRSVMKMQRQLSMRTDVGKPALDKLHQSNRHGGGRGRPSSDPGHTRSRHDAATEATTRICVGNLPWSTTADDLDRLFSCHGQVTTASVATSRGRSKGYGFVEMPATVAAGVMDTMSGTALSGRVLKIRRARPQR